MNKSPNAKVLAMEIIRYIGDQVSESGLPIERLPELSNLIGAPSDQFATGLVNNLIERGVITVGNVIGGQNSARFYGVNLSLDGWEQYEAEKRGDFEGNYGFIAMQFGDDKLDAFVGEVIKPSIVEHLGLEFVDMRDTARAGIIDDIMRITIRDAKFVIADLTHDNNGAYWEAGYAEGLGKPVIYICEKIKFNKDAPHFDVNHCTTVMWSADNPDEFCTELVAVLRRSLDV